MFRTMACAALLLSSTASIAQAPDLAAAFGARQSVQSASLSPDGKLIAMIASGAGASDYLYVIDTTATAGATPKRILTATGKPEHLIGCQWIGATRLACTVYVRQYYNGDFYGARTVIGVDADGANQRVLSKRAGENRLYADWRGGEIIDQLPGEDGKVLMMRAYVPEEKIGSVIAKSAKGMGVDWLDTRTGQTKRIESPKADAVEYISDGAGNIRIMGTYLHDDTGYAEGKTRYQYRPVTGGNWQSLSTYDGWNKTGFNPYYIDPKKNAAYGFEMVDGRRALVQVELGGATQHTTLVSNPRVDVDSILTVGRDRRVVGASFETETRERVYFDPAIKSMSNALSRALGGKSTWIGDVSQDETKMLVWAGSDTDPGQYYLFDNTAKKLSPIAPDRPQLTGVALSPMKTISYPAGDGTMIPAYLTLPVGGARKNLPAIVMPHGGPEARDYYGFDWLVQYFAARGFAVIQPNFRGSAGYGQDWLMKNGFKSWRTSIGDVVDAGKYLVSQGIADPAKLTIFGWSYGGYAALQANVLSPGTFKAAVAVAPVTDLAGLIAANRFSSGYYLTKDYIGTGPHLQEGSPAQNAAAINVPVLMFHGTMDANVRVNQSQLMNDRLKAAGKRSELVIFDGLDHQLDDAEARKTMLQKSADFLLAAGK